MNIDREPNEDARPASPDRPGTDSLSASAAERRRLLLKGLGRGSAVVAAAIPLNSFATLQTQRLYILPIGTTGKNQCSVSGNQSGFHSGGPNSTAAQCGGNKISSWCDTSRTWPSGCDKTVKCNTIFSRCTLTVSTGQWWAPKRAATLWEVVTQSPNSDDAHWVCAWLNSCGPSTLNFPYATAEVMKFYQANDATTTAALTFFKNYTEMS